MAPLTILLLSHCLAAAPGELSPLPVTALHCAAAPGEPWAPTGSALLLLAKPQVPPCCGVPAAPRSQPFSSSPGSPSPTPGRTRVWGEPPPRPGSTVPPGLLSLQSPECHSLISRASEERQRWRVQKGGQRELEGDGRPKRGHKWDGNGAISSAFPSGLKGLSHGDSGT